MRTRTLGTTSLRAKGVIFGALCLWLILAVTTQAFAANQFDEAVKLGREAADQVAKEYKFISDPESLERVTTIGNAIAEIAKTTEVRAAYGTSALMPFDYSFKILDDKEVNAFALPGGHVYVYQGLLDHVQSDDELAAVIAHEIAHIAHNHGMQLLKAQQKQLTTMAIAVLVGAAAGASSADLGTLAHAMSLYRIARLSDYGQDAEFDADRTAVHYLAQTNYNPVGMLTFMERFARESSRKVNIDPGIFATHPPFHKRARVIIDELEKLGVPINRRLVTTYMRVDVKPVEEFEAAAIWIGDNEIVTIAPGDAERAEARAERIAGRLSEQLIAGARLHDVRVGGGNQYVVVMGKVIFSPTEDDAELAGQTVPQLVNSTAEAIRRVLFKEFLDQRY